ncbi:MAG TPA: LCP family protein [Candidatus Saccharimonadia bacterium]|nr:LCP family protein [Candidatus Saccharimonadia bacterium]
MIRKFMLALLLFLIFGVVTVSVAIGLTVRRYIPSVTAFFNAAQLSPQQLFTLVQEGLHTQPDAQNGTVAFLILGLDEVPGRNEPTLTDSIILALLNLNTAKVTLVSIPRDLWIDQYKTKINALYVYGKDKFPDHPEEFPKEVVEQIAGTPIQHVVVLKLSDVGNFIDALGGVDVNVQHSFTDAQFPIPGVDVARVHDPKLLYKTVTFTQGVEHMSGERALEFMRSRHSLDAVEGTDPARSARQQLVIFAVMSRIKTAVAQLDFATLGHAYAFYRETYINAISPQQLIAIGRVLGKRAANLTITTTDITPLLVNPPLSKHEGQWVFEPKDPTWGTIAKTIQASASGELAQ